MDRYVVIFSDDCDECRMQKDVNGSWVAVSDAQMLLNENQKLHYQLSELIKKNEELQCEINRLLVQNLTLS